MAYLSITNVGNIGLYWQIAGLTNPFNTTYYIEAGYSTNAVTDGTSTRPSVIDSILATSSGSSYSSPIEYYASSGTYTPGKQYTSYGWVRAANGKYYSAGSATYTMNISAPSAPVLGNAYTDALYITWGSVAGATKYTIRWRIGTETYSSYTTTNTNTYYTIPNLTAGTQYNVSVCAVGANATSSYSNATYMSTLAPPVPSVPGQPVVSSRTSSSLSLSWTASTGSPTSYTLTYRPTGSTSWSYKPNITSNSTVLSGLTSGETYDLAVCALNSSGNSDYSTPTVTGTTLPQTPLLFENSGLPYLVGQNFIDVPAVVPSGKYTAINVDIYTNSGSLITTIAVSSGGTATFTGLTADTPYKIKARTRLYVNSTNLYSDWSYEHTITTQPAIPTLPTPTLNTSLTTKTATSISVTINAVTGATIYYCYLYNSSGSTLISGKSSSSRTFSFTGLSTNTQYAIKIKCGGTGYLDSNWSNFYYATTGLYLWEWFTEKTSGGNFNVTASEWLAFMNKINEVRAAKNLAPWGFGISEVYSGGTFKYYLFTQCANAIADIQNNIGGVNSACQNVQAGDIIYAVYFENLRAALNNVINTL